MDNDILREAVESRFWAKVDKSGDCWEWQGYRLPKGYGRIYAFGKSWMTHHMSLLLEGSDIPSGMIVCHHCDNPPCVNPDHLFIGTHVDNARDRDKKGRNHVYSKEQYRAMQKKQAKERRRFGKDDIYEIRNSHASSRELGRRYGCDHTLIWQIRNYRVYSDVE